MPNNKYYEMDNIIYEFPEDMDDETILDKIKSFIKSPARMNDNQKQELAGLFGAYLRDVFTGRIAKEGIERDLQALDRISTGKGTAEDMLNFIGPSGTFIGTKGFAQSEVKRSNFKGSEQEYITKVLSKSKTLEETIRNVHNKYDREFEDKVKNNLQFKNLIKVYNNLLKSDEPLSEEGLQKLFTIRNNIMMETPGFKTWQDTGFYVGPDDSIYYELSDKYATLKDFESLELKDKKIKHPIKHNKLDVKVYEGTLGDIYNHEELYKAYPGLKTKKIKIIDDEGGKLAQEFGFVGEMNPLTGETTLIQDLKDPDAYSKLMEIINHETNHWIQRYEDFAVGTNTSSGKKWAIGLLENELLNLFDPTSDPSLYSTKLANQYILKLDKDIEKLRNMTKREFYNLAYGEITAENSAQRKILYDSLRLEEEKFGISSNALMSSDVYSTYPRLYEPIQEELIILKPKKETK